MRHIRHHVFLLTVCAVVVSGCGGVRSEQTAPTPAADRGAGRSDPPERAAELGASKASCALRAVTWLAEGKASQLATSFSAQTAVEAQLAELAARVGALSGIEEVTAPRFKSHNRLTVGQAASPYAGTWVNAKSARLGDVQFHVAMSPTATCELLALHLDTAR